MKKHVILVSGFNGISIVFESFRHELEKRGYDVVDCKFPVREEICWASYEKVFNSIKDKIPGSIVIAHSIGCPMTTKYVVAHPESAPDCFISLAGFGQPFTTPNRPDLDRATLETTIHPSIGKKFAALVPHRYSFFSDNDHVVPREYLEEYPILIGANAIEIPGIGHMGSKSGLTELPEVIEIIEKL